MKRRGNHHIAFIIGEPPDGDCAASTGGSVFWAIFAGIASCVMICGIPQAI
jgi:hypothetical protein